MLACDVTICNISTLTKPHLHSVHDLESKVRACHMWLGTAQHCSPAVQQVVPTAQLPQVSQKSQSNISCACGCECGSVRADMQLQADILSDANTQQVCAGKACVSHTDIASKATVPSAYRRLPFWEDCRT